jgi:ribosome-associated translation inhibitor RaiA
MHVHFQILGIHDDPQLRIDLEHELQSLNTLMPIAHAQISLERQHETTPPFQAVVLLAVSGPDIHAAARDHTWPAAWQKVMTRLREQLEQRQSRKAARKKGPTRLHRTAMRHAN